MNYTLITDRKCAYKGKPLLQKYGMLTIVSVLIPARGTKTERYPIGPMIWLVDCVCDCGGFRRNVKINSLITNHVRSCGCLHNTKKKHGLARHPLYPHYAAMVDRCTSESNKGWKDYGGRGIRVCSEWMDANNGLALFISHMGEKPKGRRVSIDRIDNDGDYKPGNVRWATPKLQGSNRRTNRLLTIDGVARTVSQWAELKGISRRVIFTRLDLGWSDYEAVNTKVRFRSK